MISEIHRKRFVWLLIIFPAVIALGVCIPGFRPKHIRDIFLSFLNMRGVGAAVYFACILMLFPASIRLKIEGWAPSAIAGSFILFSILLFVDLCSALLQVEPAAANMMLRLAFLGLILWGMLDGPSRRACCIAALKPARLFRLLQSRWLKVFFIICFLFFIRQEMHMYLTRGTPFVPFEDEITWWWAMAKGILLGGLQKSIHDFRYTPGVGWLISLPARLFGTSETEWLVPYPLFLFLGYVVYLIETAISREGFLAAFSLLFYAFLASRDLHHLFGGTLYGEALASFLVAIAACFLGSLWFKRPTTWKPYFGLGLFLSFCSLSKPPISSLAQVAPFFLVILIFLKGGNSKAIRFRNGAVFLTVSLFSYVLWKWAGGVYEHALGEELRANPGVDFAVPLGIIRGLFNWTSPQFAYTTSLVVAITLAALSRKRDYLYACLLVLGVYWGSVLVLYATAWKASETYSAGRYLSHGAIGLILALPFFWDVARVPVRQVKLKVTI